MKYLSALLLTIILMPSVLNTMDIKSMVKVDKKEETLINQIKVDVTLLTREDADYTSYDSSGFHFKRNHQGKFEYCDRVYDINNLTLASYRARAHFQITNVNQSNATVQYKLIYTHQAGNDETITNAITIPIGHERSIYLGLKAHFLAALTIQAFRAKSNLPYEDIQSSEDVCVESLISGNHGTAIMGSTVKKLLN